MTRSPLLDTFDPFATHPFTNNSGLVPLPPLSSLHSSLPPTIPSSSSIQSMNSMPSTPNLQDAPQKQPVHTATLPIFVPYRGHTSSPQLVLKKLPLTNDPDTPDFRYTQSSTTTKLLCT